MAIKKKICQSATNVNLKGHGIQKVVIDIGQLKNDSKMFLNPKKA